MMCQVWHALHTRQVRAWHQGVCVMLGVWTRLHERARGRRREPDRLSDGNLGRLLERLCRAGGQLVRRGERDRRRRGGEREESRLGGRVGQREGGDDVEAEGA